MSAAGRPRTEGHGRRPPARHTAPSIAIFALAFVILVSSGLVVVASAAPVRMKHLRVNGRQVVVPEMATVAEVEAISGTEIHPGSLRAIDGRTIPGGATQPIVTINGRPAGDLEVPPPEASVEISSAEEITEEADPAVIDYGQEAGPLVWRTLWLPGAPGKRQVLRGRRSGIEIPLEIVVAPSPAVTRLESNALALTFDDGPDRNWTPAVLDVLRDKGVKATFFVVGSRVERGRDLIEREIAEGHSVQDHSWTHVHNFGLLGDEEVRAEMLDTADAIQAISGRRPTFFRPPEGALSPPIESMAAGNGFRIAMWNVDPQDWAGKSAAEIYDRVSTGIGGGDIILLHDGGTDRSQTVEALPAIIDDLRARGVEFVTLN